MCTQRGLFFNIILTDSWEEDKGDIQRQEERGKVGRNVLWQACHMIIGLLTSLALTNIWNTVRKRNLLRFCFFCQQHTLPSMPCCNPFPYSPWNVCFSLLLSNSVPICHDILKTECGFHMNVNPWKAIRMELDSFPITSPPFILSLFEM